MQLDFKDSHHSRYCWLPIQHSFSSDSLLTRSDFYLTLYLRQIIWFSFLVNSTGWLSNIKPTLNSWAKIHLVRIHCFFINRWVWFMKILLRIFVSLLMRVIGLISLSFVFLVKQSSVFGFGFDSKLMLASQWTRQYFFPFGFLEEFV